MEKKAVISTIVLVIALVLALGYIGFDKYSDWKLQKDISLYQSGVTYGYEQAIIGVARGVTSCQEVPLVIGNDTINVVWVECLGIATS